MCTDECMFVNNIVVCTSWCHQLNRLQYIFRINHKTLQIVHKQDGFDKCPQQKHVFNVRPTEKTSELRIKLYRVVG